MRISFLSLPLVLLLPLPQAAHAGMGAVFPKYHAPPCEGGACKGDDPRSGLPCQGFLCTFSSAKSLQPPVTGSQAAAPVAPAPVAAPPSAMPPVAEAKPNKRKISAKRSKTREAKADKAPPVVDPAKVDPAPAH